MEVVEDMEVMAVQALVVSMVQVLVLVMVEQEDSMVVEQVTVVVVDTILMQSRYMFKCSVEDACRFPSQQSMHLG